MPSEAAPHSTISIWRTVGVRTRSTRMPRSIWYVLLARGFGGAGGWPGVASGTNQYTPEISRRNGSTYVIGARDSTVTRIELVSPGVIGIAGPPDEDQ